MRPFRRGILMARAVIGLIAAIFWMVFAMALSYRILFKPDTLVHVTTGRVTHD